MKARLAEISASFEKALRFCAGFFSLRNPVAILGVALLVRLVYISFLKEGYYFSDYRAYEQAALSLLSGQGFPADYARPPIYPLFISASFLSFGVHFYTIRTIQAILGALGCYFIYQIGRMLLSERAALIAGWLSVFYPYYVFIAGLMYPTLLSTFFHIAALYFYLQAVRRGSLWATAWGSVCLGLAALGTPMSVVFLPFLLVWFLFISKIFRQRKWLHASISLIIVFLCLLPWTYYNYARGGGLVLLDSRAVGHLPYFTGADTTATARKAAYASRLQTILAHPGQFTWRSAGEFLHFWSFVPDRVVTRDPNYRARIHGEDPRMVVKHPFTSPLLDAVSIITYGPVFILAIFGIVAMATRWQMLSLPFFLLISQALGYSLVFTQVRYRLPVEFCLMLLAAGGLDAGLRKYRGEPETAQGIWPST